MSISVDESSKDWTAFFEQERLKYPGFMKDWFDTNGEITGAGNLSKWKWEVRQYRKDRRRFIAELARRVTPQVEKPPLASKASDLEKKAIPKQPFPKNSKHHQIRERRLHSSQSSMPKPTKRSQAWKRSGRKKRGGNKALRSTKVPFKMVIEVNSFKSSAETGHWHNHLTIAELAGPSLKVHEEFKCCSMKVRFIPKDITTGAGLYAACLLDQNGFGDPVAATTVWFPRVADLPGARLCHITRGCVFTWHPTEPDSRNFRKSDTESKTVVASFYIFGDSASLSIKGQLLITGLLRARGEYYSANIASRIRELSLLNTPEDTAQEDAEHDDIESLDD